MYSSCIFCSQHVGSNESLETFPVGKVVAFDGSKGRLWVVCPTCGRWNLAPLEERWEAVEQAEEQFRNTRLRVQSGNIGVAQRPEGTRLVRVGEALPGELAAWRYGRELRERRQRHRVQQIVKVVVGVVMMEAVLLRVMARQKEVVYRLASEESPTGTSVLVREKNLRGAHIQMEQNGELRVSLLPAVFSRRQRLSAWINGRGSMPVITLGGISAHDLLRRAMVRVNAPGASESDLRGALELVERYGSPSDILRQVAEGALMIRERRWTVTKPLAAYRRPEATGTRLPLSAMLAFEMALHEEDERVALEGELRSLRHRWREAEEIASIADAL